MKAIELYIISAMSNQGRSDIYYFEDVSIIGSFWYEPLHQNPEVLVKAAHQDHNIPPRSVVQTLGWMCAHTMGSPLAI